MVYFVRRLYESDNDKSKHKKELKYAVDSWLKDYFLKLGINYCEGEIVFNCYGKPYLKKHKDLFFNISHCHELGVCIVDNHEVGIDAENIRPWRPRVAKRVFSDREMQLFKKAENKDEFFFRLWTLKESFVKAIGIGISYPMKSCEFLIYDDHIESYGCEEYSFYQVILNDKFICSVCKKDNKKNNFCRIYNDSELFQLDLK